MDRNLERLELIPGKPSDTEHTIFMGLIIVADPRDGLLRKSGTRRADGDEPRLRLT